MLDFVTHTTGCWLAGRCLAASTQPPPVTLVAVHSLAWKAFAWPSTRLSLALSVSRQQTPPWRGQCRIKRRIFNIIGQEQQQHQQQQDYSVARFICFSLERELSWLSKSPERAPLLIIIIVVLLHQGLCLSGHHARFFSALKF